MTARGIRNNNPGNIRDTDAPWEGVTGSDGAFEQFKRSWWGIRALAKVLLNYQRKYGLKTIDQIIDRWAPPEDDNDTRAYAMHVANHLGVGKHVAIDLSDFATLRKLVEAIIKHENGAQPYTWEIDTGIILAGIDPPQRDYT